MAERAEAIVGVAVADVIVVGADDHNLLSECWITALNEGQDVPHPAEGLVVTAGIASGLEAEFRELLDDVGGGRPASPAAPLPSFERVVGEHAHVPPGFRGADRGVGGGHFLRGLPAGGGMEDRGRHEGDDPGDVPGDGSAAGERAGAGAGLRGVRHDGQGLLARRRSGVQNSRRTISPDHGVSSRFRPPSSGRPSRVGKARRAGRRSGAGEVAEWSNARLC